MSSRRLTGWRPNGDWRRIVPVVLALLITIYGGLLRLDAFTGKYGTIDRPAWARVLTQNIAPVGAALRPSSVVWKREPRPYVGGDPINYLRFAREMRGFYDAHVREPVFLAVTRVWLWALDNQDAAVSFASLTGSTLVILGTYLLGSALLSPFAGAMAAFLVAVEYEMVIWGPDGWRDDTFTATVVFAAWALIRLYQRPSTPNAWLAGGLCGIACLTRITALSFVVPGLVWLVAARPPGATASGDSYPTRQQRAKYAAVAIATCALVLGPFLINCAIATGDPFFSINYHTIYYRSAEGQASDRPVGAAQYILAKFIAHPFATVDTAFEGLFLQPFIEKWRGFSPWSLRLPGILEALSLIGLAACAFFSAGRLALVLLVSSLIPYMVTWNIGDNAWRFTMHAYPFYLVALASAVVGAVRVASWVRHRDNALGRPQASRLVRPAVVVTALAALGIAAHFLLPWLVIREAIAKGESTSVETGRRDRVFYRDGWFPPHRDGIVTRVAGERAMVRIPMSKGRNYEVVLRMDPVDPASQQRVSVLFNGHLVGRPELTWDPARVGTYRIPVRGDIVETGNRLTIIPESLVPAGSAGPRYAWMNPADRIGIRLWYVRVLPLP